MSNPLGEITSSPPADAPVEPPKESTAVDTPSVKSKKKLCSINDVLPASVIALVKANPNNDTIRNLLLAHTRVTVPASEDDFDKIKEWIEWNVAPPPKPKSSWELEMERHQAEIARQQEEWARQQANQVAIAVTAKDRQHGRCSYHNDRRGQGEMRLTRDTLAIIAANAQDPEQFFQQVEDVLEEDDPGDYLTMYYHGEVDYDDHESDDDRDYESVEVTLQAAGKAALKEALRTLSPDTFRRLFPE